MKNYISTESDRNNFLTTLYHDNYFNSPILGIMKWILRLINEKWILTGDFITGGWGGGTTGLLGVWSSGSTGLSTTFVTGFLSNGWKVFSTGTGISMSCSSSRMTCVCWKSKTYYDGKFSRSHSHFRWLTILIHSWLSPVTVKTSTLYIIIYNTKY